MNQSDSGPDVVVGMPVYNGATYVRETLESLLAQTHEQWLLVVSDNGSTDGTVEILRDFAARDNRISVVENAENRGAVWNYNNAFLQAPPSTFFMWLCADDVIEPSYLAAMIERLSDDPDAIGAYAKAYKIDSTAQRIGDFSKSMAFVDLDGKGAVKRHRRALLGMPAIVLFAVFRREAMEGSSLHGDCVGGDRTFICDMVLRGRISEVPAELFARRDHDLQFSGGSLSKAERSEFMGVSADASEMGVRIRAHVRIVLESDVDLPAKAIALASVLIEFPTLFAALKLRARMRRRS